jgi:cytochrome c oxidase assembly protein subunit 15
MPFSSDTAGASPWPRRWAWLTWLAALPLVAFGGTVTTLRAGMAIDGWWVLDRGHGDHFLLAYPIEKWFASSGTFAEHTHRLLGVVVGLFAIAHVVASFAARARGGRPWLALGVLAAICVQGALGGLRVLEASPELAFVHGALAQLVIALLWADVVVHTRTWRLAGDRAALDRAAPRRAWLAFAAVYAQIALGAWLRHAGAELALALHVAFAALAAGAVVAVIRGIRESAPAHGVMRKLARSLAVLLALQLGAGVLATIAVFVVSGGFLAEVSAAETIGATLHVVLGALLLQQTVAALMWSRRLAAREARPALAPSPGLGAAR